MEKRINDKFKEFLEDFKNKIKIWVEKNEEIEFKSKSELLKYVYDYDTFTLEKIDFAKRKRVKSHVACNERCMALRSNGEQCSRKRKDGLCYCGTHETNHRNGKKSEEPNVNETSTRVEVWLEEMKGILYYIDKECHVYKTEDILSNKSNPEIIGRYAVKEGQYMLVKTI